MARYESQGRRMSIFLFLQLRVGLLMLICIIPSFSSSFFAILICYFEVEDVGTGIVARFTLDTNCTSYMIPMFFHSIFQTTAEFSNVRLTTNSFMSGSLVDYILFEVKKNFVLMDFRVSVPLKITCTLVWQKILLNASGSLRIQGIEIPSTTMPTTSAIPVWLSICHSGINICLSPN